MKKTVLSLIALVLILGIGTVGVFAAEGERRGNYADENGDGICDNRTGGQCPSYADANGDGICDNHPHDQHNCPSGSGICNKREDCGGQNFADEDGDGVCDNRENTHGGHHGKGHSCH